MSKLTLVTPEGEFLTNQKPITPSPEVEYVEDPLWLLAEREAKKQSTNNHQQGNDNV
jgi:hypothetical protein